ncbi:MAG TPA: J domain-containing protein [Bacteroidetes bacterium]|nr:J domain-containing protein [Bacteroidota bacterium]
MPNNYYQILGVHAKASQDEIKKAYRKKAMATHPDVSTQTGATETFIRVNEAYDILADPQKRAVYNDKLKGFPYRQPRTGKTNNRTRDTAYQEWVRQANARARQSAKMKYGDFKKSRFERTEERTFLYLQFVVMGVLCLLAAFFFTLPIVAMFFVNWKAVFFMLITTPVSHKIITEALRGVRQIRDSL